MRFYLTPLAFVIVLSSSGLAQTPPPPPDEWKAQLAFFSSVPTRFPAAKTTEFEQLVADGVQVYRDGALVHRTRDGWIKELQSYKQRSSTDPQGFSVSRDQYNMVAGGGVSVREFIYPIAPNGAQIIYHPNFPLRYVTYRFSGGKVVRVDYGEAMESYAGLCQQVAKAKGITPDC